MSAGSIELAVQILRMSTVTKWETDGVTPCLGEINRSGVCKKLWNK